MAKFTERVVFMATPAQAQKLRDLARGEGRTVSAVLQCMVEAVAAEEVVHRSLVFKDPKIATIKKRQTA